MHSLYSLTKREGMQGRGEIVVMQQMVDSLKSGMRLLVASVRSPDDLVALASQVSMVSTHVSLLSMVPSKAVGEMLSLPCRAATPSPSRQTAQRSCSRSASRSRPRCSLSGMLPRSGRHDGC